MSSSLCKEQILVSCEPAGTGRNFSLGLTTLTTLWCSLARWCCHCGLPAWRGRGRCTLCVCVCRWDSGMGWGWGTWKQALGWVAKFPPLSQQLYFLTTQAFYKNLIRHQMLSAKLCPEGTVASLEGSLESQKGNRMRERQDIKKWKTKDPFKVCDWLSWKLKGCFTLRDPGVWVLGCIFSPLPYLSVGFAAILQAGLAVQCLIGINLPNVTKTAYQSA